MMIGLLVWGCTTPQSDDETGFELGGFDDDDGNIDDHGACDDLLECVGEVEPSAIGPLLEAYGSEGECWKSEENAELCRDACADALAQYRELFPGECGGGPGPGAELESIDVDWYLDDRIEVTVDGGTDLQLGMVEAFYNGWQGEDCYQGMHSILVCHSLDDDGHTTIEYVSSLDDVADGYTLMGNADPEKVTYMVIAPNDDCWTFGEDPSYYADLGCDEI